MAREDGVSQYQKFVAQTIRRSEIRNAQYNPRKLDAAARKKLLRNLRQVGLIETIVWNRRTGNLVSGHQRLSILDELEGGREYSLTVAVVDMDEAAERAQNVFMNNPLAQGEFDTSLLTDLLREDPSAASDMGFEKCDLVALLGDAADEIIPADGQESIERDIETLRSMRAKLRAGVEAAQDRQSPEIYVCFVFPDAQSVDRFLLLYGADPGGRYLDGPDLAQRLGLDVGPL